MSKVIAVVDGNSLMHRAFHAVPPAMTTPDGTPTNAAFGFLSMLFKFIEVANPDAIVCAFDRGRPAFRMEALAQYKAQRPPMDPDLKVQFPLIENLLEAMGIPVVCVDGWEGDDILGTIAARDEALGYQTLLVTGDKDAYQLASPLTSVMTTKKGITDVVIYGPAEVYERYGVTPPQVPDFLGLKGDKSDNIPGVPGIGEKKAAALLQEYESLEGIYENLGAFKGKQLENLTNFKEDAFLSRTVATISRDVEFELDLENISFPNFDAAVVTEAFKEVRFTAHLNKALSFLDGVSTSSAVLELKGWTPVVYGSDAFDLLQKARNQKRQLSVSWALESQASLFSSGLKVAVCTGEGTALFTDDEAQSVLADLVREADFAVYGLKMLLEQVFPADTTKVALVSAADVLACRAFDVALAAYVVNASLGQLGLSEIAERYAGAFYQEPEELTDESLACRAALVAHLVAPLKAELVKADVATVYENIDLPLVGVLACMERVGAALDVEALARISVATQAEIDQLKEAIIALAGEEFNIDSPKQLSHILFEVIGLKPIKKNQRGFSTDAQVLKELSKEHELPGLVLRYREYAKIKSTYIDALPQMRSDDNRIHTSFNEMVTATGRLSSSNPNLQNIPVRSDYGRHIRECFVPLNTDELFMSADYSQIELRLLAHLSNDERLIEAFLTGVDFHTQTASHVFDVSVDAVTPEMRSRAKAVNFGIVYGQQAFGLSQSLDISFYDAKQMIDRYFEVYQGVRCYLDDVVAKAHRCGYAQTMFGRKRFIPELKASNAQKRNFGERTAMNHPMQGSAADIIKLAMRRVQERLISEGCRTQLMLQVHDELDFSVPKNEVESVSALVKESMESVVQLSVPLVVDVSVGSNWAEAH